MHQDLLQAENGSAIVNAEISDGTIWAGLIVTVPLCPRSMLFDGVYQIELPDELIMQGITCSLVDVEMSFRIVEKS